MFSHRDTVEGDLRVQVAFTDVSLDVAEGAEDRDEAIGRLEHELGVRIVRMHQVHGDHVEQVTSYDEVPTADGLITSAPGLALMARAADCVPVLLADPVHGVIGAVHAGRVGTQVGVVPAAVRAMRAAGAEQITAWIGPHVCGRCYEVPAELRAEVAAAVPETYAETSWGTPSLDLGAGVRSQLETLGCVVRHVERCTLEDHSLHSHRRDGVAAGRGAALVWIES